MTVYLRCVWAAACLVGIAADFRTALADNEFTIVVLPDTQNYVNDPANASIFGEQTEWIVDQIGVEGNPRNIQFVTHLGDLVSHGDSVEEFQIADAAISQLDGIVPYSVLPGNHDYTPGSGSAGYYLEHFGPQRFSDYAWYGGADPSGRSSFQRITAGGFEFIHLALEWHPTRAQSGGGLSPIEWAQSVLDAHPTVPVLVSTHEYLSDFPSGRSIVGEALWDQLVSTNDQIFMVLGGHSHQGHLAYDGEYHQVSLNHAGRPVLEVLQNFEDYLNGGNGWLRLLQFDQSANEIVFETYSPFLDDYQLETTDEVGPYASRFSLSIDFETRFVPVLDADGDFNGDGVVDAADYTVWRDTLNATGDNLLADANNDLVIDTADYLIWRYAYGSSNYAGATVAPEPAAIAWVLAVAAALPSRGRWGC